MGSGLRSVLACFLFGFGCCMPSDSMLSPSLEKVPIGQATYGGDPSLSETLVQAVCLVLSREWGNGYGDYYWGLYKYYFRDPFPHSLLRTRQQCQVSVSTVHTFLVYH